MEDANVCVLSDDFKSLLSICRSGSDAVEDITDVSELARIYDECVSSFNDACLLSLNMDDDNFCDLVEVKNLIEGIMNKIGILTRVVKEECRVFHSDSDPDKVKKVLDLLIDFK